MSRRDELLDLAEDVLERDGLDAFGVGSLARAAGVKPPSLYKHFSGIEDIAAALVSRGLSAFAEGMADASGSTRNPQAILTAFAAAYRREALARPQLYRLMTSRPLDRDALPPGAEESAMAALLAVFGEDAAHHDVARAAWAWAHGLASLELAGRFPADADLDAAWEVLVDSLAERARLAAS